MIQHCHDSLKRLSTEKKILGKTAGYESFEGQGVSPGLNAVLGPSPSAFTTHLNTAPLVSSRRAEICAPLVLFRLHSKTPSLFTDIDVHAKQPCTIRHAAQQSCQVLTRSGMPVKSVPFLRVPLLASVQPPPMQSLHSHAKN